MRDTKKSCSQLTVLAAPCLLAWDNTGRSTYTNDFTSQMAEPSLRYVHSTQPLARSDNPMILHKFHLHSKTSEFIMSNILL